MAMVGLLSLGSIAIDGVGVVVVGTRPGENNLGDYHTKHQPAAVHKVMRPIQTYVEGESPTSLQGCIGVMDGQTASGPNLSSALASTIRATYLPNSRRP